MNSLIVYVRRGSGPNSVLQGFREDGDATVVIVQHEEIPIALGDRRRVHLSALRTMLKMLETLRYPCMAWCFETLAFAS